MFVPPKVFGEEQTALHGIQGLRFHHPPGIEPMYPAVEAQSVNHWTAREVLGGHLKTKILYKFHCKATNQQPVFTIPDRLHCHPLFLKVDDTSTHDVVSEINEYVGTMLNFTSDFNLFCLSCFKKLSLDTDTTGESQGKVGQDELGDGDWHAYTVDTKYKIAHS